MFPRTQLFIFRIIFIVLLVPFFSCKQAAVKSEQEALRNKHQPKKDSIEKQLALNDSYYIKSRELNNKVNDFRDDIRILILRFKQACGDNTGNELPVAAENNTNITNQFFFDKQGPASSFVSSLQALQDEFRKSTTDTALLKKINELTEPGLDINASNFMEKYFKNTPPIAAITILHKLDNDVKSLQEAVLADYLK